MPRCLESGMSRAAARGRLTMDICEGRYRVHRRPPPDFRQGMLQRKTEAARLRFYPLFATLYSPLTQPPRRVREQGVDEPRVRGEVAAQRLRSAVLARDFVEQPFELGDIAVDRLLETAIGAVFARDFVERLLAGRRVEPLGERL